MATVAWALRRLVTTSSAPAPAASRAAASATLGVPTASSTTSLGLGTVTSASAAAANVRTGKASETMPGSLRSEEHTSELQSRRDLVCRLLLEKKKSNRNSL